MAIKIQGLEKLEASVEKLIKATGKEATGKVLLEQAEIVRDKIKEKAPQGPTGNLKRSPIAKLMPEKDQYPAIAIAGIDRKIAPHAHLLEFGTVKMAPHPFFRPAVDETKGQVMDGIKAGLKKNIEDAI